jgi:hypothetical protein
MQAVGIVLQRTTPATCVGSVGEVQVCGARFSFPFAVGKAEKSMTKAVPFFTPNNSSRVQGGSHGENFVVFRFQGATGRRLLSTMIFHLCGLRNPLKLL